MWGEVRQPPPSHCGVVGLSSSVCGWSSSDRASFVCLFLAVREALLYWWLAGRLLQEAREAATDLRAYAGDLLSGVFTNFNLFDVLGLALVAAGIALHYQDGGADDGGESDAAHWARAILALATIMHWLRLLSTLKHSSHLGPLLRMIQAGGLAMACGA